MNTHMYTHPLTAKHLKVLKDEIGYEVVGPIGKELACGDVGTFSLPSSSISSLSCSTD
jgi:phosphopantothenoylcysteine decarboxylase